MNSTNQLPFTERLARFLFLTNKADGKKREENTEEVKEREDYGKLETDSQIMQGERRNLRAHTQPAEA